MLSIEINKIKEEYGSISELCKSKGITRQSFYNYQKRGITLEQARKYKLLKYTNVKQLLEQIEKEL